MTFELKTKSGLILGSCKASTPFEAALAIIRDLGTETYDDLVEAAEGEYGLTWEE